MSRPENPKPWMGPLPAAPGCACHVCRRDDAYDESDRQTIDTVLRHGWQVMLVGSDAECSHPDHLGHVEDDHHDSSPSFAYTVGLGHRRGHPELLISGLDYRVMHHVLNNVAHRVMQGRRLTPGDALEDVLAGVPVAVEKVAEEALDETVIWSGWFHRRKPEALAIVWPDRNGVFGWHPGANRVLDQLQPPEWRVRLQHTGGLATDPVWTFPVPPDHRAFSCSHVVDRGDAVLWAARQSDATRGEDWSIHCGALGHATADIRVVHLAHLVRAAPSLRDLSTLGLDEEALRPDADSSWSTAPLTQTDM